MYGVLERVEVAVSSKPYSAEYGLVSHPKQTKKKTEIKML